MAREEWPVMSWIHNGGNAAEPPLDAEGWRAIIRGVSPRLIVILVARPGGEWFLDTAQENPPLAVGHGPFPIEPVDHKHDVRAALTAAGKPVI
jgi:hypothetical protein